MPLPLQTEQQTEDAPEAVVAPLPPLRVLVVDDEAAVAAVISGFLTADGHSVETACNGVEGLQKFRAGQFNLVLTDRAMPEMNGDQFAAVVKQLAPTVPVVMVTGFGDFMRAAGERPAGVDYVVRKPIAFAALRQAMAKAMNRKNPKDAKPVNGFR